MKRKGLQFEHTIGKTGATGFAIDYDRGDVIAQMSITRPMAVIPEKSADIGFQEPGGQMAFPIHNYPAKVNWAAANKQGRASGAPHMLAAALAEHYGLGTVHADSSLTEEGSRMSRSAARRGLIQPHPLNPTMEPTMSVRMREQDVREGLLGAYQNAYEGDRSWGGARYKGGVRVNAMDKFSPEQMSRAAQRVFSGRRSKPGSRESYTQGTLF